MKTGDKTVLAPFKDKIRAARKELGEHKKSLSAMKLQWLKCKDSVKPAAMKQAIVNHEKRVSKLKH